MMASRIRHRVAGEILAVSARANRDMMRPPNGPEFRWAMRAEPCRNESAPEAAAFSPLAVTIPPHWLVLNRDRLAGQARYDVPDDRARLRLTLASLDVALQEPRELAPIEPPPAGFQAGEKVELPLCQRAHHEPDPVARAASSADEASHRFDVGAAREDRIGQHLLLDTQVIPQQALQHCAQIRGRLEIAILEELRRVQTRPVRNDAATVKPAADQESDRARAVVRALRPVDARGSPELGDNGHDRFAPRFTHVALDRGKGAVER